MKVLELFAGSRSISKAAIAQGHETFNQQGRQEMVQGTCED
jgi:hypothetical protein